MRTPTLALVLALSPLTARAQETPIDALFTRCHSGEAVACTAAGARYELGRGAPQDLTRSVDLYTRGCATGDAAGCGLLGALYADGRGVPRDDARASSLLRQACDAGHAHSCGQVGRMMILGRGTPRDIPGSASFLDRGCAANHAIACELLGRMLVGGLGVPQNFARGQTLLQRACGAGRRTACNASAATPAPGGVYAAPPPVTDDFAAPPPVTGAWTAPAPVVVASPPRTVYVPRVRTVYVPRPAESPGSSVSPVSLLGGGHRASMYFLGADTSVMRGADLADGTFFRTGFRHSRGPVEFAFDARFGGGSVATDLRPRGTNRSWTTFALGTQLGVNLLSWPRSDRERFSVINLSGGVEGAFAFGAPEGAESVRVGGYVANTTFFLCWLGVRTEFTGSLVGANTWGHTFHASLFFGGRPSSMCR
jgi:hypothetical protein